MIGKPEWFQRRKYGGWGLTPRTWQGWVYIAVMILPFIAIRYLPIENKTIYMLIWAAIFVADFVHMMFTLKKDERETKIEALAERNATYAMVVILTMGVAYEVAVSAIKKVVAVDPFIIAAIIAGLLAKSITNIYYERKGI